MPYLEITVQTDSDHVEELQGFLYTLPIGGLVIDDPKDGWETKKTAPDWVVVEDDLLRDLSAPIYVRAYLEESEAKESLDALDAFLQDMPTMGDIKFTQMVDEEAWAESWKQYFHPIEIGERLLVRPTWEDADPKGRVVLSIDPGMAFGSGTHETTQLCLTQLEKIEMEGYRVADIGCGSGILSIACALFGAKDVQAIDIEPMSIRMTEENAAQNGVSDVIRARLGNLLEGIEGPIDILVSNILAEILVEMIPVMKPVLSENAYIVLSGIIEEREHMVREALENSGYTVAAVDYQGGWCMIYARG